MKLHHACLAASVLILAWLGPAGIALADQPAGAAACPRPATAPVYFLGSEVDMVALLAPPPAADSVAQREDLEGVIHAQKGAHDSGAIERAVADAVPDCARIADVLGAAARTDASANVIALLTRAALEADTASVAPKRYWKRPRPYVMSPEVERLADVAPDAIAAASVAGDCDKQLTAEQRRGVQQRAAFDVGHASYPSGHSTFGTVCAILLANAVPEKREELFARGREYGHSRVIVGAHYPSDVEAGRITGTVAAALLLQNPLFERDFAAARGQLRAQLSLPEIPRLEPPAGAQAPH
ncbi:MAG TPA: phosphatase PAP2 family protein [Steroidobacteraceae bacterium]